ncbi:glycoside hydrolase [Tricharina praecox]|uniref:glycoside hydrolase n=1 Tax=Tricharina praecox TaxID=43433 RepID=UPI00221E3FAA|nr:glycoside hydrolase [Tricharina praecox]KAI5842340.1 glycoside hydrolase [Tricharina praecox]
MKFLSTALLFAAVIGQASAHYRFFKLIANGVTGAEYASIRTSTNSNSPVTDVTSTDLRCNVGGLASAASTTTTTITAGSTIGFVADTVVSHPGPFIVYMAKAPSTAAAFDGSGAVWFKVWEKGTTSLTATAINFDVTSTQWTFPVPKSLPDGEYLVRIEHIALHGASSFGGAQFYISCAQVKVTGGGSGTPGPKVAIPGVYTGNEPSIKLSIYWPIPTNYTVPGPAVWSG